MRLQHIPFYPLILLLLITVGGCIGTDYIADPPQTFDPVIEVTGEKTALQVGQTLQLMAQYFDESGEEAPAVITWSSSNSSVASVDASGLVTGLQVGQATLTASSGAVSSEPFLLTVVEDENAVANVVISPESLSFSPGDSVLLSAKATTVTGASVSPTTLVWSSNNVAVATVDQQGLVRGIAPGTATIVVEADGVRSKGMVVTVQSASPMRTGMFQKKPGTSYDVRGTARLEGAGSNLTLSFGDDFVCSDGPRLHVYLAKQDRVDGQSVDIGPLMNTAGPQTYTLPVGVGLNDFNYIIIHCVPFNVTFGFAMLTN